MLVLLKVGLMILATVLTNAGKAITTNRLKGAGTEPNYLAWGTGAGIAAIADTTLFIEASETRVAATTSQQTTTTTNDTYRAVATLTCTGAGKTITNAGLFDALTVGNLFVKGDFTGVVLNVADAIQFTINTQYT